MQCRFFSGPRQSHSSGRRSEGSLGGDSREWRKEMWRLHVSTSRAGIFRAVSLVFGTEMCNRHSLNVCWTEEWLTCCFFWTASKADQPSLHGFHKRFVVSGIPRASSALPPAHLTGLTLLGGGSLCLVALSLNSCLKTISREPSPTFQSFLFPLDSHAT